MAQISKKERIKPTRTSYITQEFKEKFDAWDLNMDGGLNVCELRRMMQYFGYNPTEREANECWKKINKNNDDEIDFKEFYDYMSKLPDPFKELEEAFMFHDKNEDGFIDRSELKAILTANSCASDAEVDDLFNLVDEDKDGKLRYEEFIKIFQNEEKPKDDLKGKDKMFKDAKARIKHELY